MKSACDLLTARKELQAKLDLKEKRILFLKKGFFYEHGNKSSKFLAKALRDIRSSTHISQIKTSDNKLLNMTEQIASEFHHFYFKLYHLPTTHKSAHLEGTRPQIIQQYLEQSGIPDGFSTMYYKAFTSLISKPLLNALNSLKDPQ